MSEEKPPETPEWVAKIHERMDGLAQSLESVKPKPAKSDRDVLDEISAGIAKLGEALSGLVTPTGKPSTPPPDPTPKPPTEPKPARKGNPWTAHRRSE